MGSLSEALDKKLEHFKEGERTIVLRMNPGTRPEVEFTGFWTGKFIRSAQDSISRAYRLGKPKMHPKRVEPTPTGVKKEV